MTIKRAGWLRLDNAAKIFPATCGRKDTGVFRFSCDLTDEVESEALQRALDKTVKKFPHFLYAIRGGMFWYYLEESGLRPLVHQENTEVCTRLFDRNRRNLLFDVSYYRRRINLEVYHALSDGAGAVEFLKELVYQYLTDAMDLQLPAPEDSSALSQRMEDSFQKYSHKPTKSKARKMRAAYQLRYTANRSPHYRVLEGVISCRKILALAKEKNVSLTVLLSAFLLQAIRAEMPLRKLDRPVVLNVPVNLRKVFPSRTARNFFGNIYVEYQFGEQAPSIDAVADAIKGAFELELRDERLADRLNTMTALEYNPALRIAPLPLKNIALRIARKICDRTETVVLSNIGRVDMPEALSPMIEHFSVYSSTRSMHLCVCSFGDRLSLSFTAPFIQTDIQRNFFRLLQAHGIEATLRCNYE